MIRPDDFVIDIGHGESGCFVRVTHKPTGNQRCAESVADNQVGPTRDQLVSELRRELFDENDIRVEYGRAEGGGFMRVVHLPTGIERWTKRHEGRRVEDLLDEILTECLAKKSLG